MTIRKLLMPIVAALTLFVWPPLLPIALFFIGGVQDRNYSVWGHAPVMTVQRNDLQPPELGWIFTRERSIRLLRAVWLSQSQLVPKFPLKNCDEVKLFLTDARVA